MSAEPVTDVRDLPTGLRIDAVGEDNWSTFYEPLLRAFGQRSESQESRKLWHDLAEFDRSMVVSDGEEGVGTAGAYSFRMTVPGGATVAAPGVTMVSVASTHRRRGILRAMMRRQMDDFRARGEAVAILTASEPAIYGRFGYGNASEQVSMEIDSNRVRLTLPEGTDRVRLRFADPRAAVDRCEEIYAKRVPQRPGMLERLPGWSRLPVHDPESERNGADALLCVLAELDGETTGYARYAIKGEWDRSSPKGTVQLRDIEALDPVTYAALWDYLLAIDLTSTVSTHNRPSDDPVLHLVTDIRRCRVAVRDSLYVRLVDVGEALAARSYTAPVDVVLEVSDAFCPWNEGRWRLTGDAKGASCERTADRADLALSVRELGSAYLGGFSLTALAGAGRVRELREGALGEASAAFGSDPAPWLPHGF